MARGSRLGLVWGCLCCCWRVRGGEGPKGDEGMLSGVLSLGQTVTSVLFWHFLATRPPRVVLEVCNTEAVQKSPGEH